MDARGLQIEVAGERVTLMPQRAVWWPSRRTLLVADLHLGKSETFRAGGIPIPDGVMRADLARLDEALRATEAERLVVLGDLLHAPAGLTEAMIDGFASWRASRPIELAIVPGNHDRGLARVAERWRARVTAETELEEPFAFTHDPARASGRFTWCGHVHPLASICGGGDSLRVPCFHIGRRAGVLPSFSAFTRGVSVARGADDRLFAIADGMVVEV